jgi:hypothetical protein
MLSADWRAVLGRGLDQLSPPEVEHTLLELPAERQEFVGILSEITGWPDRTPLQRRVPDEREIDALNKQAGRWRAVSLLDDDAALRTAAVLFRRTYVLDPLYDSGELLYAAWHDPFINPEHAQQLAHHAKLLVNAAPILRDATAVLAPDHLPGSWDPRPGWKRPRPQADQQAHKAWALRTALVLLYWAERLDALVVVAREDVVQALPIALGSTACFHPLALPLPPPLDAAASHRADMAPVWARARRASRRRSLRCLPEVACACQQLGWPDQPHQSWQLVLGAKSLADPALLLRRALNGQDPLKQPSLPPTALRKRPLCLLAQGA